MQFKTTSWRKIKDSKQLGLKLISPFMNSVTWKDHRDGRQHARSRVHWKQIWLSTTLPVDSTFLHERGNLSLASGFEL